MIFTRAAKLQFWSRRDQVASPFSNVGSLPLKVSRLEVDGIVEVLFPHGVAFATLAPRVGELSLFAQRGQLDVRDPHRDADERAPLRAAGDVRLAIVDKVRVQTRAFRDQDRQVAAGLVLRLLVKFGDLSQFGELVLAKAELVRGERVRNARVDDSVETILDLLPDVNFLVGRRPKGAQEPT